MATKATKRKTPTPAKKSVLTADEKLDAILEQLAVMEQRIGERFEDVGEAIEDVKNTVIAFSE